MLVHEVNEGRRARLGPGLAPIVVTAWTALLPACSEPERVDPSPPQVLGDEVEPAAPPLSRLDVPVGIPLRTLLELLESAVPTRFGTLETFHQVEEGGRASVAFDLEREPFRGEMLGELARLRTTIRYSVRVSYDLPLLPDPGGDCGLDDTPRPRLDVALESPIAIGPDWSLSTQVAIQEIRPASTDAEDRCEVTLLGLDITDDLVEGARAELEEHLQKIDDLAAGVGLRARVASWWSTLREPIQLEDDLWLSMHPEVVSQGEIRGVGDSVYITLSLGARPRIVFGERPDPGPHTLPTLGSEPVSPGLQLLVDGRAEYGTASTFLQERVGGTEVEVRGRRVVVDSIRVFGLGGGQVALELEVSGDARGRLFLTGQPEVDRQTGIISVPDLRLDVATRDVVLSTVAWLADQGFRDFLREQATWPSDPVVAWMREWLEEGLNRSLSDDLRVSGSVDSLTIVGVQALRDDLLVRISAHGDASLFVER